MRKVSRVVSSVIIKPTGSISFIVDADVTILTDRQHPSIAAHQLTLSVPNFARTAHSAIAVAVPIRRN